MKPAESIRISPADWSVSRDRLRAVRQAVFVQEQGIPAELEWDDRDAGALHLLASAGETPIGVIRMLADGHLGRMAVLAEWRRAGVGSRLLSAMLAQARHRGLRRVYLHAQADAVAFYARHGFAVYGGPFREAGIAHQAMEYIFPQEAARES